MIDQRLRPKSDTHNVARGKVQKKQARFQAKKITYPSYNQWNNGTTGDPKQWVDSYLQPGHAGAYKKKGNNVNQITGSECQ